jgi:hypothetical protein
MHMTIALRTTGRNRNRGSRARKIDQRYSGHPPVPHKNVGPARLGLIGSRLGSCCAEPAKASLITRSLGQRCDGPRTDCNRRTPARCIKASAASGSAVIRLTANRAFEVWRWEHGAVRCVGCGLTIKLSGAPRCRSRIRSRVPARPLERKVRHRVDGTSAQLPRPCWKRCGAHGPRPPQDALCASLPRNAYVSNRTEANPH